MYVDGYVLAVPEKKLADYRKMARKAGKIWKEFGALEYMETVRTTSSRQAHQLPQAVSASPASSCFLVIYKSGPRPHQRRS